MNVEAAALVLDARDIPGGRAVGVDEPAQGHVLVHDPHVRSAPAAVAGDGQLHQAHDAVVGAHDRPEDLVATLPAVQPAMVVQADAVGLRDVEGAAVVDRDAVIDQYRLAGARCPVPGALLPCRGGRREGGRCQDGDREDGTGIFMAYSFSGRVDACLPDCATRRRVIRARADCSLSRSDGTPPAGGLSARSRCAPDRVICGGSEKSRRPFRGCAVRYCCLLSRHAAAATDRCA